MIGAADKPLPNPSAISASISKLTYRESPVSRAAPIESVAESIDTPNTTPAKPALISLDLIQLNQNRLARQTNPRADAKLDASVKAKGVLSPILLKHVNSEGGAQYEVRSGERRYLSAKRVGLTSIPAIFSDDLGDDVLYLIDDCLRLDLHPVQAAESIARLKRETGMTDEAIGGITGHGRVAITQSVCIDALPHEIKIEALAIKPTLSRGILTELAHCNGMECQQQLWELVKNGAKRSTLREAKKAIDQGVAPPQQALLDATTAARAIAKHLSLVNKHELAGTSAVAFDELGKVLRPVIEEFVSLEASLQSTDAESSN